MGFIYQKQAKVMYLSEIYCSFENILWIFANNFFHFIIFAAGEQMKVESLFTEEE